MKLKALKRIAFAGLTLSKLKRGEYRKLTETELLRLRKKIGDKIMRKVIVVGGGASWTNGGCQCCTKWCESWMLLEKK